MNEVSEMDPTALSAPTDHQALGGIAPVDDRNEFLQRIDAFAAGSDETLVENAADIAAYINRHRVHLRIDDDRAAAAEVRGEVVELVARVAPMVENPEIARLLRHFEEFNVPFIAERGQPFHTHWNPGRIWRLAHKHLPAELRERVAARRPARLEEDIETPDGAIETRFAGVEFIHNLHGLTSYVGGPFALGPENPLGLPTDTNLIGDLAPMYGQWCNYHGVTATSLINYGMHREFLIAIAPYLSEFDLFALNWPEETYGPLVQFLRDINTRCAGVRLTPIRIPQGTHLTAAELLEFAPQLAYVSFPRLRDIPGDFEPAEKLRRLCEILRSLTCLQTFKCSAPYSAEIQECVTQLPIRTLVLEHGSVNTPIDLSGHPTLEEVVINHCAWHTLEVDSDASADSASDEIDDPGQTVFLLDCPKLRTVRINDCLNFTGTVETEGSPNVESVGVTLWDDPAHVYQQMLIAGPFILSDSDDEGDPLAP